MKRLFILDCLLFIFLYCTGQTPVGTWSDHLTYNTAKSLAVGSKDVYASTGSSIMVFNREFNELRKLSRINGLTETGISTIAWSEENEALIIGYSSTNLDLVLKNTIYNIPDISRKYIPGKKEINRIRTNGNYAYLACSFGIVIIDLVRKEIHDTWKPGNGSENAEVWDIAFGNGKVYAATGMGLFYAGITDPGLSYFGNWSAETRLPDPDGKYTAVLFSGNRLFTNRSGQNFSGDSVYVIDSGFSLFSYEPGIFNRSFDPAPDGFTISSNSSLRYYSANGILRKTISSYSWGSTDISMATADQENIWIADLGSGLVRVRQMTDFSELILPGPVSNNAVNITSVNGRTIICGGAVDASWNNLWRSLQVSVHENNSWNLISSETHFDAMRALIDPANSDHFFVSTWGTGLLEYDNNQLINNYTDANSPLQTIIPGKPYVRICGMAMDKNRYLWITQTEVPGSIKILKPDGTWIVNPLTIGAPTIGDIIITKSGHKWIVLPRGNGLFILDDNGTPDNFVDDVYKKMLVTDSEDKVISSVFCIAEDLDGNIWVGTDQGPVIYYNPGKVFGNDIKAFRIKIPRNDGSGLADYMLGTETITSISIDGANRKWLGTFSSGAYLLSPDGTSQIKNYNEENSPLFSNSIASVSVDGKSGNVWLATTKGILSVRGDAIAGTDEFADVFAFPNPVREDYFGKLTITGLMRDTQIRITDISGNLVFRTVSDGGEASWDLKTYNGSRVATGVYLVFCASSDGSRSCVIKVLVIK
jgi:hypothetical protein